MTRTTALTRRSFLTGAGAVLGVSAATTLLPSAPAAATTRPRQPNADLVLTHARIIDPDVGRVRHDRTVLVTGDRIVAVTRSADLPNPKATRVVDLHGRYLLPGLCDMHVHTSYEDIDLPLQVANGITTVREMWGHPWVFDWRNRIDSGMLLGPRYVIGSQIIDGNPTLWGDPNARPSAPIIASTPEQGRAAVRAEVRSGADFIKVYSRLTAPVFSAIAAECRRLGVHFAGHCPDEIPIERAADLRMWTFEHLDGLWWSTSSCERQLRADIAAVRIDPADAYDSWFRQIGALEWTAARSYDRRRAERLFSRLRRSGSWQVPTLTLNRRVDMPDGSDDPRMRYVPRPDAEFWRMHTQALTATRTPQQVKQHERLFELRLQLVGAMAAAGVPILAGTDLGTTYQFPGFSLHDELQLLVAAGVPPMQALAAATTEPARALGRGRAIGAVRTGYAADLVAVDGDPLVDIRNTQRVFAVVARGKLITAQARAGLLASAERAAAEMDGAARDGNSINRRIGC